MKLRLRSVWATIGLVTCLAGAADARQGWPTDSLHHVDVSIETSRGEVTPFARNDGRARIVTMFYASCPMACPLTIDTLRRIDADLTEQQRARLGVLLLSLDPEHDTPAALREVAARRHIDDKRWTLGRLSPGDTRKLGAALGIQYRKLDNGDFDHASVLILLDPQGRVLARSGGMGVPDPEFIRAVKKATGVGWR